MVLLKYSYCTSIIIIQTIHVLEEMTCGFGFFYCFYVVNSANSFSGLFCWHKKNKIINTFPPGHLESETQHRDQNAGLIFRHLFHKILVWMFGLFCISHWACSQQSLKGGKKPLKGQILRLKEKLHWFPAMAKLSKIPESTR